MYDNHVALPAVVQPITGSAVARVSQLAKALSQVSTIRHRQPPPLEAKRVQQFVDLIKTLVIEFGNSLLNGF
jgi:hypothetical protein